MKPGRVSVAMVTLQQEAFVGEAPRTALEQDLEDMEVVVDDDASSDGTPEIVHEWAVQHPGRVRILLYDSKL